MEIVTDTSIVMAVVAEEPEKDRIIRITQGHEIIAPFSVHWEIGNALSALVKKRKINVDRALQAIKAYESIPLRLVEVDLAKAVKMAAATGIYAYDAYVIVCSLTYAAPMMTLDKRLFVAARKAGVHVMMEPLT